MDASFPKFWIVLLIVRILSVFFVQTWFVPDEYWQSLEVAHRICYDYGYLTWEWTQGIRSWLHPLGIAVLYRTLATVGLDSRTLLVVSPRFLQACVTAFTELTFCRGLRKFLSRDQVANFFFLQVCSWYLFYVGSRTLINTVETNLALLGITYFLEKKAGLFICCVSVSCYVRPTSGALWLPFILSFLTTEYWWLQTVQGCIRVLKKSFIVMLVVVCIDCSLYNRWILVPLEFLNFNFFSNLSTFYGEHSWHWYLTNALPTLLGPSLVLVLALFLPCSKTGIASSSFPLNLFSLSAGCYLLLHSFVAHKELRFMTPLVPLMNVLAAEVLTRFSCRGRSVFKACTMLCTVVLTIYFSLVHQRGVLDLMAWLAGQKLTRNDSVLFLMPCHSTPLYSHLHEKWDLRFLQCPPNLSGLPDYEDEADVFYKRPLQWLQHQQPLPPKLIIMFDRLVDSVSSYLNDHNYSFVHQIFHTHLPEGRVGRYIFAFQRNA